ncbi:hypothetical protein R3P38DRAFT_1214262 [Favolaschia claudopus]
MDAVAEANADAKEIDDAIRIGGDVALGIEGAFDDSELEEELKKLALEAEREKVDVRLGDDSLRTPDTRPSHVELEPRREVLAS